MTTAARNGTVTDPLVQALAYEQEIAEQAAEIRATDGEHVDELMALLRKPIPSGFITTTPAGKGKPYESTGVKSMQVQINRMDAVLTAAAWGWRTEWFDAGKVAEVTVWIGREDAPVVRRSARGGVNQASTEGNRYKGSETNAGKLAFARIGPGWEVYVGAVDLDPDVSADAAKAQEGAAVEQAEQKLTPERAEKLMAIVKTAGLSDHLPAKLRGFGVTALTDLTVDQGMKLWEWCQEAAGQHG